MNKNSLALVFLGLVAVIALVGLILLGNVKLSGQAVAEEDSSTNELTGEPLKSAPKKCGVNSFRVLSGCSMGKGKIMGYGGASWKCYNGRTNTQTGPCQPASNWNNKAQMDCIGNCN